MSIESSGLRSVNLSSNEYMMMMMMMMIWWGSRRYSVKFR